MGEEGLDPSEDCHFILVVFAKVSLELFGKRNNHVLVIYYKVSLLLYSFAMF